MAKALIRATTRPRLTLDGRREGTTDRFCGIGVCRLAGVLAWVLNAHAFNNWLRAAEISTAGPYYGFWSGIGSDIAEFSLVGQPLRACTK
jgi:hypothetical protein